ASAILSTGGVWLVNPRTNERVEVQGLGDAPTVEQATEEGSILHVAVHGDLLVEPKRRRLVRTTRSGAISGAVSNADDEVLERWAMADASEKYRLIFGKVNWPVILGDYSPQSAVYLPE